MTKIEIKNSLNGEVIFANECDGNTIAITVQEAVKQKVSLCSADLSSADLSSAFLRNADLRSADLSSAFLRNADLCYADLSSAVLRNADLSSAVLSSADLRNADLSYTVLRNADLRNADLRNADLRNAVLCYADLSSAVLCSAVLRNADLSSADLSYAVLSSADLRNADLCYADLRNADLRSAVLCSAVLRNAENIPHIHMACPTDGPFIGWKRIKGYLIQLDIPSDAKRSSATSNKCRCDKAMVLSITNIKNGESINKIDNDEYAHTEYVVGQMVYPDRWDENRFNECSHGIHFFIDKQDAIDY